MSTEYEISVSARDAKPANPPAFPRTGYYPDTDDVHGDALFERMPSITEPQPGMTLRDYFAAKAMQGMLADPDTRKGVPDEAAFLRDFAAASYRVADAMLKARGQ